MSVRADITKKALFCIDEIYPSGDEVNTAFFPTEQFIDEAALWVARAVPARALGAGTSVSEGDVVLNDNGAGRIDLPADFVRLLWFNVRGWFRPVITPIYDTDITYMQQFNPALCGSPSRPVVAICEGGAHLEFFSLPREYTYADVEYRYFGFTTVDDSYPARLVDITAWKLAELVLSSMADVAAAQICQNKISELLQLL